MKTLLTTIAGVVLVGCGESQQSVPPAEAKPVEPVAEAATPEPPSAKAPDISIHDAAAAGDIDAVKQHIAAGADVNENVLGTPLHEAASSGHKEVVELLIAKGADVNAKAGISEKTPLHEAASSGHKEVVELLIANGADVNAKKKFGRTPLHGAATKGIAELLIAKGADVDGWSWEKAQRIRCVNNLKQIGIATRIYATDNQDRFPWQVPQTEGGTAEILKSAVVSRH